MHNSSHFRLFYLPSKSLLLGIKCVFKHKDLISNVTNVSHFHPLEVVEVVDRGSETQLQVDENMNRLT